jgi:phage shock protein PspC (stress-responsive transcriptional regulator)
MNGLVENIKSFFEKQAFGICEFWGEKLSIKSANIRLFFIYTSFLTIGSPIIIYLVMGFWMNLNRLIRKNRGGVWDL